MSPAVPPKLVRLPDPPPTRLIKDGTGVVWLLLPAALVLAIYFIKLLLLIGGIG